MGYLECMKKLELKQEKKENELNSIHLLVEIDNFYQLIQGYIKFLQLLYIVVHQNLKQS